MGVETHYCASENNVKDFFDSDYCFFFSGIIFAIIGTHYCASG